MPKVASHSDRLYSVLLQDNDAQQVDDDKYLGGKDELQASEDVQVQNRDGGANLSGDIGVYHVECVYPCAQEDVDFRSNRQLDEYEKVDGSNQFQDNIKRDADEDVNVGSNENIRAFALERLGRCRECRAQSVQRSGRVCSTGPRVAQGVDHRHNLGVEALKGGESIGRCSSLSEIDIGNSEGCSEYSSGDAEDSDDGEDQLGKEHDGQ